MRPARLIFLRPSVSRVLWYFQHDKFGSFTLGRGGTATNDTLYANLGGQDVAANADVMSTGGNLVTRSAGIAGTAGLNFSTGPDNISLRWRRLAPDLGSDDRNMIRYDSPKILGNFVVQGAWGSDDFWDVNLRFAKVAGDIAVAAQVGFSRDTTEQGRNFGWPPEPDADETGVGPNGNTVIDEVQASASIWHMPTGLFASAAYQWRSFDGTDPGMLNSACGAGVDAALLVGAGVACANRPDFHYLWTSAGVRRKFTGLGYTSIFGEYATSWEGVSGLSVGVVTANGADIDFVTESRLHVFGGGIVQTIDAAALDLFLTMRHYRATVSGLEANGVPVSADIDPATVIIAGGRIRF